MVVALFWYLPFAGRGMSGMPELKLVAWVAGLPSIPLPCTGVLLACDSASARME